MFGEFELISKLKKLLATNSPQVLTGIGDDAAVVEAPQLNVVATVDMMVEGVHFSLDNQSPEQVGHKALAVNLSDIAAMGALPKYALVSLGVRKGLTLEFFEALYRGMVQLARQHGVQIIGGNITSSAELSLSVTVLGEVEDAGLLRSGAKPGDIVGLVGRVGLAAAGRACLEKGEGHSDSGADWVEHFVRPVPLVEAGRMLRASGVSSLIDVSDGLSSEVHHLASASNVGFVVDSRAVEPSEDLHVWAKQCGVSAWDWVLGGGEDYALLFTIEKSLQEELVRDFEDKGLSVSFIGSVVGPGEGVWMDGEGGCRELCSSGWDHFKGC